MQKPEGRYGGSELSRRNSLILLDKRDWGLGVKAWRIFSALVLENVTGTNARDDVGFLYDDTGSDDDEND